MKHLRGPSDPPATRGLSVGVEKDCIARGSLLRQCHRCTLGLEESVGEGGECFSNRWGFLKKGPGSREKGSTIFFFGLE